MLVSDALIIPIQPKYVHSMFEQILPDCEMLRCNFCLSDMASLPAISRY